MVTVPNITRADDLPERRQRPAAAVGPAPFFGVWFNTNRASGGIVKVELTLRDDRLILHAYGAPTVLSSKPSDWGKVEAQSFATQDGSFEDEGFTARYDFGFMESFLAANQKRGILVIASYNHFKDGSGRSDYYAREFYHQL